METFLEVIKSIREPALVLLGGLIALLATLVVQRRDFGERRRHQLHEAYVRFVDRLQTALIAQQKLAISLAEHEFSDTEFLDRVAALADDLRPANTSMWELTLLEDDHERFELARTAYEKNIWDRSGDDWLAADRVDDRVERANEAVENLVERLRLPLRSLPSHKPPDDHPDANSADDVERGPKPRG